MQEKKILLEATLETSLPINSSALENNLFHC